MKRCAGSEHQQIASVLKRARQADARGPARSDPESTDRASEQDFAEVAKRVNRYHGVSDTARRADEHVARACTAIAAFPDCAAKQALLAAADYAATRDH